MEMEMDDLLNKKRDIQMMKVTREIQTYLSAPEAYDAKIASDIQKLELTVQNLRHVCTYTSLALSLYSRLIL